MFFSVTGLTSSVCRSSTSETRPYYHFLLMVAPRALCLIAVRALLTQFQSTKVTPFHLLQLKFQFVAKTWQTTWTSSSDSKTQALVRAPKNLKNVKKSRLNLVKLPLTLMLRWSKPTRIRRTTTRDSTYCLVDTTSALKRKDSSVQSCCSSRLSKMV